MNLERNKNAARFVIGSISLLLISVGCGNAPEYRYQSAGDVTSTAAKGQGGAEAKKEAAATASGDTGGHTSAVVTKEGEPAAAVSSEPELPEVTVGEILQNEKSFNNRKIRVTGRIGRIMPLYNMAFILNTKNDRYIELSYGQMPEPDRFALTRLNPLQKVTILGAWDASKRVFVGEGLVSSSQ